MIRLRGRTTVAATVAVCAALATAPAGAATYDNSNPSSTSCVKKGLVETTATIRTAGVWEIRLRRSTGCDTAWAVVRRTDSKRCQSGGANCAKVRITRIRSDGVKTATNWRKMSGGTRQQFSLQLGRVNGAIYYGTAATFGGKQLVSSGWFRVDASGNWVAA